MKFSKGFKNSADIEVKLSCVVGGVFNCIFGASNLDSSTVFGSKSPTMLGNSLISKIGGCPPWVKSIISFIAAL